MSTSVLLILIVVLWLFVLAPLVVNNRKPIRRTSDALGKTRVLHRGGQPLAATRRRPAFNESDVRDIDEPDDSLEMVDAAVEDDFNPNDVLYDDTVDDAADVVEGDVVYELPAPRRAGANAAQDKFQDESDRQPGAVSAAASDEVVDSDEAPVAADVEADSAASPGADVPSGESSRAEPVRADSSDAVTSAELPVERMRRGLLETDELMYVERPAAANPVAEEAESDSDIVEANEAAEAVETDEAAEESAAEHTAASATDADESADDFELVDDTLTEEDYAFAQRRRGRGGFDPESDARYAQTRFARRRRSVAGLSAAVVVTAVIAAVAGGWTWWLPVISVALLALYLWNLRRTVRAEQELRARRIRRMKMARLGVRHRDDSELGIPERLRRPGAVVVSLDDEDPDFADVPYGEFDFDGAPEYPQSHQERVS